MEENDECYMQLRKIYSVKMRKARERFEICSLGFNLEIVE